MDPAEGEFSPLTSIDLSYPTCGRGASESKPDELKMVGEKLLREEILGSPGHYDGSFSQTGMLATQYKQ